jgi:hypothetical protein
MQSLSIHRGGASELWLCVEPAVTPNCSTREWYLPLAYNFSRNKRLWPRYRMRRVGTAGKAAAWMLGCRSRLPRGPNPLAVISRGKPLKCTRFGESPGAHTDRYEHGMCPPARGARTTNSHTGHRHWPARQAQAQSATSSSDGLANRASAAAISRPITMTSCHCAADNRSGWRVRSRTVSLNARRLPAAVV